MESTVIVSTKNGNNYYVDTNEKISGYVHPLYSWLFSYKEKNKTFDSIPDTVNIEGIGTFSKEIIQYYVKKYEFLKGHGLNSNSKNNVSELMSPEIIEYQIANLKQLTFELTDSCNLKCKYCGYGDFYSDYDERENNFLSFEMAKSIIDYLAEKWSSSLNSSSNGSTYISFYGGEPLLCVPLMEKIISYVHSLDLNRKIQYNMTSNGLLLDRYADFLVKNQIILTISLDGNEFNNSYRVDHVGKSSFNRLFQNLKHLEKKHPAYFYEKVQFNSVLHNRNSVEEVFSFIKKEFGKVPIISELNNSGIKKEKIEEFKKTYKNYKENLNQSEHYDEITKDLKFDSPDVNALYLFAMQNSGVFYKSYYELLKNSKEEIKLPTGTCLPFEKRMFITVNGKILPCERIGHQFGLGEIKDNSVNIDTSLISVRYNDYFQKLRKQCSLCYRSSSCIQCLFNLPDIDMEKSRCHGFMTKETYEKDYLTGIFTTLENNPVFYKEFIEIMRFAM